MYQQGLWFVYSSIGQIPSKPTYKRTLFKYHVGIIFIPSIQRNHLEKIFEKTYLEKISKIQKNEPFRF